MTPFSSKIGCQGDGFDETTEVTAPAQVVVQQFVDLRFSGVGFLDENPSMVNT
jgi:hypothetical protein